MLLYVHMSVLNFRSAEFLLDHIRHTMAFYHPRAIDPCGGFFHFFKDDGAVYDASTRHLVSSTRFVFNYSMAYRQFRDPAYLEATQHGVRFLRDVHRNAATGGHAWVLRDGAVLDGTNHCYGLAFVMLAYAHALMAGVPDARALLDETFELMERRFWLREFGLYGDEAAPDWSELYPYRGQNANMHACEAMLAAYDATSAQRYLERAYALADNITRRQAALANGRIWEHYRADWTIDWDYNRDNKTNIFRPWGFQPGHFTEWAKLLLILERNAHKLTGDTRWLAPRARELFDDALANAWDHTHGGIYYGFAPDNSICDSDKYFWVQAESLAAAALLAVRMDDEKYWQWYERLWSYSWQHFVDHRYGAWYRLLSADNRKYSDEKSPAGKTDYHTMGACYEVLSVLQPAARRK